MIANNKINLNQEILQHMDDLTNDIIRKAQVIFQIFNHKLMISIFLFLFFDLVLKSKAKYQNIFKIKRKVFLLDSNFINISIYFT